MVTSLRIHGLGPTHERITRTVLEKYQKISFADLERLPERERDAVALQWFVYEIKKNEVFFWFSNWQTRLLPVLRQALHMLDAQAALRTSYLLDAAAAEWVEIRRLDLDEADRALAPETTRYGDECEAKLEEIEAELRQVSSQLMRDSEQSFVDTKES